MSRHGSAIPVAFVTSWTTLTLSLPAAGTASLTRPSAR
jgi:hypothetical protein